MKKFLLGLLVPMMILSLVSQTVFTVDVHAAIGANVTPVSSDVVATDNTVSTYVDTDNSSHDIQTDTPMNEDQPKVDFGWIWIIIGIAMIGLAAVIVYIVIEDKKKDDPVKENAQE